jgi:hypothetical protein
LTPQSGPKIVAILNEGFGPPVISISGATQLSARPFGGYGAEGA